MLSLVTPDQRVPKDHPLRKVKTLADAALAALSPTFDEMYSKVGRPSIPPERLLKSTLLMAFYSVRSERLFCEQLDYNLLFRWFLDMDGVAPGQPHRELPRGEAVERNARVDDRPRGEARAQGQQPARNKRRRSAVDGRTVRHTGYEISQRIRKRVEEIFGWTKTVASFRKTRFRGQARTQLAAHLVAAAYNLLRISKLMPA